MEYDRDAKGVRSLDDITVWHSKTVYLNDGTLSFLKHRFNNEPKISGRLNLQKLASLEDIRRTA